MGGGFALPLTVILSTRIDKGQELALSMWGDRIHPKPEFPVEAQSRNVTLFSIMQWLSGSKSTPAIGGVPSVLLKVVRSTSRFDTFMTDMP